MTSHWDETITEHALRYFQQQRCPAFVVLWGKTLACGLGRTEHTHHHYLIDVSAEAEAL